jgi:hypothetical protein
VPRTRWIRRWWRAAVLAVLGLVGALVAIAPGEAQTAPMGFGASSSAFGARVSITISKAPLVPNIVDAGGPLAQTTLDSLGTSISLASFPYPGDVVLNLPGLLAGLGPQAPGLVSGIPGLIGSNVPGLPTDVLNLLSQVQLPGELIEPLVASAPPLPPYPFAAQADSFTPHQEVDLGVGKLTADASTQRVAASATSAPGASGTLLVPLEARSTIEQHDDGSLVVESTGSISGLRVGPIVIGSVTSTARISRSADGTVEKESSFRASAIQVGALTVDLTPEGMSIGGTPVPAPIASTVNGALAAAGLELRVLPKVETASAVVASGLELIRPQDFGPLGTGTIKLILGQSSATLDNAVAGPAPSAPGVDVPVDLGGGSLGTGADLGTDSGILPSPAGVSGPRSPASSGGAEVVGQRAAAAEPFDATGLYLLLILAGVVIVGIGPALRLLPALVRSKPPTSPE